MRAPNRLQSIIDRPRPAEMPKEAFCLDYSIKAKILEIDYTVTIAIIPAPESAQSHNGPVVTRIPVSYYISKGGSQTTFIRAKPSIGQNN